MAVLLPGALLYAGTPFPPARKFLDAGAVVALSTDFNPGTSPTTNLPRRATLGCTQLGMTVAESLAAVTYVGAKALGLEATYGSLDVGKRFAVAAFPVEAPEEIPARYDELEGRLVR